MSLVSLGRAVGRQFRYGVPQSELTKRFYDRGMVFIHVPKCGGTSVERGMRATYPLSRLRINSEATAVAAKATGLPADASTRDILGVASNIRTYVLRYALGCGYHCITGHAPLAEGLIGFHKGTHDFVTILREPVSRFKSHFTFSYKTGRHGSVEESIEEFLETPRAVDMGRLFIKYYGNVDFYGDYDVNRAIENCKATLSQMSAVGFVDQMGQFGADISQLRKKPINIGHVNKGSSEQRKSEIFTPEITNRIKELCAEDIEIYQWARGIYSKKS